MDNGNLMRILTAQEHGLMGSTVDDKYTKKPYVPLIVVDGEMSVEECNKQRRSKGFLEGCLGRYYGKKGFAYVHLEPLVVEKDSKRYGQTVQDPMLLGNPMENCERSKDLSNQFPYGRD